MRLANKPPPNSQRVDFLDASTAHNSPVCWGRQEKSCTQQGLLVCKIFVVTALANSGFLTTLCDVASGGAAGPCLPTTRINYSTIATYGFGLMIAKARAAPFGKAQSGLPASLQFGCIRQEDCSCQQPILILIRTLVRRHNDPGQHV